ncbi:MAG: T9SS type A sorting domain-containing protein, partial [Flavobacteriaceae bacterium]|nr:T9SS type A sorting domain-containing protein [Flavobacteriaceae bacterium]
YNLEIDNNLTGVQVNDSFGIIVENTVNLVTGDFRLIGEAQLIQNHSGVNMNNTVSGNLLRDQQGNYSAYGYNYYGSPVNSSGTFSISEGLFDGTDAVINPFGPQAILYNSGPPYDGAPSIVDGDGNVTTPLILNASWFYKYARGSGSVAEWNKITENSPLNPGEGFIYKGTNTTDPTQNYVFKGEPNNGDYQFSINSGEYSLLGNPYPSAIDSDEFIRDNISVAEGGYDINDAITGTLYFWVEGGSTSHYYAGYLGGYATYNLTGGAPPSVVPILVAGLGNSNNAAPPEKFMAVAQGFFVEGGDNGIIKFKNSQRKFITENSGESVHYKSASTVKDEKSLIRIGYVDPEGFHRQLVLGFIPNSKADLGYNRAYDAIMFGEREDELYFIIDNDLTKKYVIQGVGEFDFRTEFPLGLKMTEEGKHTIMLDATENFDYSVFIKDKILNYTHDLRESPLELDLSSGDYANRFQLIFEPQATLNVNEFENGKVKVYYDGNNNIIIDNHEGMNLKKISIYNMIGQLILAKDNYGLNDNKIRIPFKKKEGVYLVTIESDKGNSGTYKIFNRRK